MGDTESAWSRFGLGALWQPQPFEYEFHKVPVRRADRIETDIMHLLAIDTPHGREGFAYRPDALRAFLDAGASQLTGLALQRDTTTLKASDGLVPRRY